MHLKITFMDNAGTKLAFYNSFNSYIKELMLKFYFTKNNSGYSTMKHPFCMLCC